MREERKLKMRDMGVYVCPDWCTQPDNEHEYEAHFSDYLRFDLMANGALAELEADEDHRPDGYGFDFRIWYCWESDDGADSNVEMVFVDSTVPPGGPNTMIMTVDDWATLFELQQELVARHIGHPDTEYVDAYPDAAEDEAAAYDRERAGAT